MNMINTFLSEVLSDLRKRGTDKEVVNLVFPTIRAIRAFRKISGGYSPRMLTMSRLMRDITHLEKADSVDIIFSLYSTYICVCRAHGFSPMDFESFYPWGEMMLSDFNDVDSAMADADSVFRDTGHVKEIDSAPFADRKMIAELKEYFSTFEQAMEPSMRGQYRRMWDMLGEIYHNFNARAKRRTYEGAIYRRGAEICAQQPVCNRYIFIGFCLLSRAERTLMKRFKDEGKAEFYWDFTPGFYGCNGLEVKEMESYIREFGNSLPETPLPELPAAEIISTSTISSEAAYIPSWLQLRAMQQGETAAVILSDPSVLPAVRHYLGSLNYESAISFPVSMTAVYADIMRSLDAFRQSLSPESSTSVEDILKAISDAVEKSYQDPDSESNNIEYAAFEEAGKALERTRQLISLHQDASLSPRGIIMLFKSLFSHKTKNEEEDEVKNRKENSGICILELHDTRATDFDRVVMINCEEGVLPCTQRKSTMLPNIVRMAWGLFPNASRSISDAYDFTRLLKRTPDISLVYSTASSGTGKSEASRYILQLMAGEIKRSCRRYSLTAKAEAVPGKTYSVSKTPEMFEKLETLEPTPMTKYIKCPLLFYYSKIASIREPLPRKDKMPANLFGTIFHAAMQYYYEGKESPVISPEIIDQDLKDSTHIYTGNCIRKALDECKIEEDCILFGLILHYMLKVLEYDKKNAPFTIVPDLTEKLIYTEVTLADGHKIKVGGRFDRVHIKEGVYTVVDYKTSKWKDPIKAKSLEDVFENPDKVAHFDYILQTMLYSLVLKDRLEKDGITNAVVKPELYFITGMNKENYSPSINIGKSEVDDIAPFADDLRGYITDVVMNIFDMDKEFCATPSKKFCEFCNYSLLCNSAVTQ